MQLGVIILPTSLHLFYDRSAEFSKERIATQDSFQCRSRSRNKGFSVFEITGDYVILLNKYLDGINGEYPDSDEFWEQLAADVDQFYSAHRQKIL